MVCRPGHGIALRRACEPLQSDRCAHAASMNGCGDAQQFVPAGVSPKVRKREPATGGSLRTSARGTHELAYFGFIDRVPPYAANFQRACDDHRIDHGQDFLDIALRAASVDQQRQMRCRPYLPQVVDAGSVAGPRARGDDRVGVEELDVAHEFFQRAVRHDRVGAVLDVRVGKHAYALCAKLGTVAQRTRRFAFDEPFIGNVRVGQLIDAHERGVARRGDGQRRYRSIREHVDADWQPGFAGDAVGRYGHECGRFVANVVGLRERHVAVVLDDRPIDAALRVSARVRERGCVERFARAAVVARCAGKSGVQSIERRPPNQSKCCLSTVSLLSLSQVTK